MARLDLERISEEDASIRFFDELGNTLIAAKLCLEIYHKKHKVSQIAGIQALKLTFYKQLAEFQNSRYRPKGKINRKALNKFYQFQRMPWIDSQNFARVMAYLHSLRS